MAVFKALLTPRAPATQTDELALRAVTDFFAARCAGSDAGLRTIEEIVGLMGAVLDTVERDTAGEYLTAKIAAGLALEADFSPQAIIDALAEVQAVHQLSQFRVAVRLLGDPELVELPMDVLVELCVGMLLAVAPIDEVSLWNLRSGDAPTLLHSGGGQPSRSSIDRAGLALEEGAASPTVLTHTAAVHCWHRTVAVLVWTPKPGGDAEADVLGDRVARLLGPAFERASLVETNLQGATALVSSSERRLARLSFDLHDGPLQDVSLMSARVRELRRHLEAALPHDATGTQVFADLDDLAALIEFLDNDLRDLASSLDAPVLVRRPFVEVLTAIVRKFGARCLTEAELVVEGEPDTLSDSQRIALARVVQEALNNVADHSDARSVRVSMIAGPQRVEAIIEDDGIGFDVDEALRSAGRSGRMGLLGMVERIRLLGGGCTIQSRVGDGTRIALTMTRWDAGAATDSSSAIA